MKWKIRGQQIFCVKCKENSPTGFKEVERIGYLCHSCRELWFSLREKCLNQARELFIKEPIKDE